MVTCICPTRARPTFIQRAIDCFLSQTWPDRELLILDEEFAPSLPGDPHLPGVRYERLRTRLTVGAKRNLCCSRAHGDLIAHWDDDDWSAPGRLLDQIERLIDSDAPMTGYDAMEFREENGGRWLYSLPRHAIATSLLYLKSYWAKHPFSDLNCGQDETFSMGCRQLVTVPADGLMWASIHPGNTSPRDVRRQGQKRFKPVEAFA